MRDYCRILVKTRAPSWVYQEMAESVGRIVDVAE